MVLLGLGMLLWREEWWGGWRMHLMLDRSISGR
jgi:hypothetical protein